MIRIHSYTGQFQAAIRPAVNLRRIRKVAIHDNPDAREIDDFKRALAAQGRALGQWDRSLPRLKMDVYDIVPAAAEIEPDFA